MVAGAKCSCSNTRYTSPGQWHTARKIFHIQNKIFHIENQQKKCNIWRLKTYLNCQSEASHGNPLSSHWQLLSRKIFTVSGLMIFEEDFKSSEADLLKPCQVRFLLLSLQLQLILVLMIQSLFHFIKQEQNKPWFAISLQCVWIETKYC